jgi:hypothetical protein
MLKIVGFYYKNDSNILYTSPAPQLPGTDFGLGSYHLNMFKCSINVSRVIIELRRIYFKKHQSCVVCISYRAEICVEQYLSHIDRISQFCSASSFYFAIALWFACLVLSSMYILHWYFYTVQILICIIYLCRGKPNWNNNNVLYQRLIVAWVNWF